MPERILVTGGDGQLGQELRQLLEGLKAVTASFAGHKDLDVTDPAATAAFFRAFEPTLVVNCAAYTAVDKAEEEHQAAFLVNETAPGILAKAAAEISATLIHISTDFVFDGKSPIPYTEDAAVNPLSVYGKSKQMGEAAVLASGARSFIVRTSWLYSRFGANFVKTILRLSAERDEIRVVFDQVGSPTCAADLAAAILEMIPLLPQKTPRIYHFADTGVASWFDLAQAIVALSGVQCRVVPVETSEFPTKAKRPSYSVLNTARVRREFGIEIPYWRDSLGNCLEKMGVRP